MLKVTCLVLIQETTVLLAKRNQTQSNAGKWEFPGGKIKVNESLEECIIREINEELELTIQPNFQCTTFITGNIELVPFFTKTWLGTMKPCEHEALEFVPFKHLLTYDLSAADIPLAHFIMDNWDTINARF